MFCRSCDLKASAQCWKPCFFSPCYLLPESPEKNVGAYCTTDPTGGPGSDWGLPGYNLQQVSVQSKQRHNCGAFSFTGSHGTKCAMWSGCSEFPIVVQAVLLVQGGGISAHSKWMRCNCTAQNCLLSRCMFLCNARELQSHYTIPQQK